MQAFLMRLLYGLLLSFVSSLPRPTNRHEKVKIPAPAHPLYKLPPTALPFITVNPIQLTNPSSAIDFGAILDSLDVEHLTDADCETIHNALYQYDVICVKNHKNPSPRAQAELRRRFGPKTKSYRQGKTLDARRSVVPPDLKTICSIASKVIKSINFA